MNIFKAAHCDTNELTVFPPRGRTCFIGCEQTPGVHSSLSDLYIFSSLFYGIYMFLVPFKSPTSFLAQHRISGHPLTPPKKSRGIEFKKEIFQKELPNIYTVF